MHKLTKHNSIVMVNHFANKTLLISIIFCIVMISQISRANERNNHLSFNSDTQLLTYFNENGSDNSNSIIGTKHSSSLSYEERLQCQKAIEKVYWNYRIWPKENHGPKPAFEEVMNEEALREKVNDTLTQYARHWRELLVS